MKPRNLRKIWMIIQESRVLILYDQILCLLIKPLPNYLMVFQKTLS